MHSWRGRWIDFYSKRNPDPHYWLRKLGLSDQNEERIEKVELPKPKVQLKNSGKFLQHEDRMLRKFHWELMKIDPDNRPDAWIEFVDKVSVSLDRKPDLIFNTIA